MSDAPTMRLLGLEACGAGHVLARFEATDALSFDAGQWINLHVQSVGAGGDVERDAKAVSFASAPLELPLVELCVRCKPESRLVPALQALSVGDTLSYDGPYGAFRLEGPLDGPLLVLATSTGLAAVRSIVRERLAQSPSTEACLLHGIADEPDHVFADEVATWSEAWNGFESRARTCSGDESDAATWEPLLEEARSWLREHDGARVLMAGHGTWIKPFRRELKEAWGLDRTRVRAEIFWP